MSKVLIFLSLFVMVNPSANSLLISNLPVSAREAALGYTAPALAEGSLGIFSNPSSMVFRGLAKHSFGSSFIPIGNQRFAGSAVYSNSLRPSWAVGGYFRFLGLWGIESRDPLGNKTGEFNYLEWQAGLGSALRTTYHLAGGIMAQMVGQSLASGSARNFQLNVGGLYRPFLTYPLRLGATLNWEPLVRKWTSGWREKDPPSVAYAIAYELWPKLWLGIGGKTGSDPGGFGGGASWTHSRSGTSLRISANKNQMAIGAGFHQILKYRLNYAYVIERLGPGNRHLFSTEFEF